MSSQWYSGESVTVNHTADVLTANDSCDYTENNVIYTIRTGLFWWFMLVIVIIYIQKGSVILVLCTFFKIILTSDFLLNISLNMTYKEQVEIYYQRYFRAKKNIKF